MKHLRFAGDYLLEEYIILYNRPKHQIYFSWNGPSLGYSISRKEALRRHMLPVINKELRSHITSKPIYLRIIMSKTPYLRDTTGIPSLSPKLLSSINPINRIASNALNQTFDATIFLPNSDSSGKLTRL